MNFGMITENILIWRLHHCQIKRSVAELHWLGNEVFYYGQTCNYLWTITQMRYKVNNYRLKIVYIYREFAFLNLVVIPKLIKWLLNFSCTAFKYMLQLYHRRLKVINFFDFVNDFKKRNHVAHYLLFFFDFRMQVCIFLLNRERLSVIVIHIEIITNFETMQTEYRFKSLRILMNIFDFLNVIIKQLRVNWK